MALDRVLSGYSLGLELDWKMGVVVLTLQYLGLISNKVTTFPIVHLCKPFVT